MQQIYPSQVAEWARAQAQRPVLLDVREGWEVQTACAQPQDLDFVHMPMQTCRHACTNSTATAITDCP